MKKIITVLLVTVVLCTVTNAQFQVKNNLPVPNSTELLSTTSLINQAEVLQGFANSPVKDYAFYMRHCHNMRITGLVLLGTGLVSSGIALILATNNNSSYNNNNGNTVVALFIVGAATGIASIPFMVLAHVNKNKARAMLTTQKTGFDNRSLINKNINGITITLPL